MVKSDEPEVIEGPVAEDSQSSMLASMASKGGVFSESDWSG
jgi:hypothetical protein